MLWPRFIPAMLIAVLLALPPQPANAEYPDRPVTMIVPFAPGGPADIVGRILSTFMPQTLGQSIVIENRGGAAGNIGMGYRRARQARRLHAADDVDRDFGEHGAVPEPALRSGQGFRADLRARQRAERPRRPARFRHRDDRRPRRAGESLAQHLQLRQSGRGYEVPSHRRAAQAARRHRHGACAVPRRGSGGAGGARRADPGRLGRARRRRAADASPAICARSPSPANSAGSRCRTCRR